MTPPAGSCALIEVTGLPETPLDAAAHFHHAFAPGVRGIKGGDVVLLFAPAGHEHQGWRLAAVQELAREAAPRRVNAICGTDQAAIGQTVGFLDRMPGVTGQILVVGALGYETC